MKKHIIVAGHSECRVCGMPNELFPLVECPGSKPRVMIVGDNSGSMSDAGFQRLIKALGENNVIQPTSPDLCNCTHCRQKRETIKQNEAKVDTDGESFIDLLNALLGVDTSDKRIELSSTELTILEAIHHNSMPVVLVETKRLPVEIREAANKFNALGLVEIKASTLSGQAMYTITDLGKEYLLPEVNPVAEDEPDAVTLNLDQIQLLLQVAESPRNIRDVQEGNYACGLHALAKYDLIHIHDHAVFLTETGEDHVAKIIGLAV